MLFVFFPLVWIVQFSYERKLVSPIKALFGYNKFSIQFAITNKKELFTNLVAISTAVFHMSVRASPMFSFLIS